jgi:hypothetical protein
MSFFKSLLIAMLTLIMVSGATAQSDSLKIFTNNPLWLTYIGSHKISNKWSVFMDLQLRRDGIGASPMQYIFRPGLIFHINDNTSVSVGYAFIGTDVYGKLPARAAFPEHRTWQQLQFRSQHGRVELQNRLRIEQRWVNVPVRQIDGVYEPGDAVYTNRMRIQNKFSIPFKGKTIVAKSLYFTVGDEVHINFGKNVRLNAFDQNRAFAGLGYAIPHLGRVEAVYINQFVFRGNAKDVENNNTLWISWFANIDLRKKATK